MSASISGPCLRAGLGVSKAARSHWCIAAKEAVGFPLRTCRVIRRPHHQCPHDFLILSCGCQIYRLVQIVRWRMVALRKPVFEDLLLWRSFLKTHAHGQRRHAMADKVVLIRSEEHTS